MSRRLLNVIPIVSFLLCVAMCALWVRSYWHRDHIVRYSGERIYGLFSIEGSLVLLARQDDKDREPSWSVGSDQVNANALRRPSISVINRLGFAHVGIQPLGYVAGSYYRRLWLPHWSVMAAAGILPAVHLCARVLRRRFHFGQCPRCGYDLRATPDRCPECGTMAPVAPAE